MAQPRMKVAELDDARLERLRTLEDELGTCIVALTPQYPRADLPADKIERLQAAEQEMGVVLLAYQKGE